MGLSDNNFKDGALTDEFDNLDPKLGVQWRIYDWLQLRLAMFDSFKRALVVDQTIEPTQIAGFNQFFDDISGTEITQYSVGLDARLAGSLFGGAEAVRRDLEVPLLNLQTSSTVTEDQRENWYRMYVYWAPLPRWAGSAEFRYDRFTRKDPLTDILRPTDVETIGIPFTIKYFRSRGFFSQAGITYVHQEVSKPLLAEAMSGQDDFLVLDAAIGYRLPKRRGSSVWRVPISLTRSVSSRMKTSN